jgi:propanol-preferring alcohol dehydrogenase
MRAMVLETPGQPLREAELSDPEPSSGQVLLEVRACGVCRTDLHIVDGELPMQVAGGRGVRGGGGG